MIRIIQSFSFKQQYLIPTGLKKNDHFYDYNRQLKQQQQHQKLKIINRKKLYIWYIFIY